MVFSPITPEIDLCRHPYRQWKQVIYICLWESSPTAEVGFKSFTFEKLMSLTSFLVGWCTDITVNSL